ncbi:MAG: LytTR family DNA-binding domain-containing protein [Calditrichales bacterium]|nr:LytTR family DNA-binding domain-containing protein [Calditrichales bacterium]
MEKITAIIVDDEPEAQDLLENIIKDEFPNIEIRGIASNVDEGIELIIRKKPEIVFLDIQMPRKNGFELLQELQHLDVDPSIIFTTAYDEFAIEAIRHSAFDYLQKPIKVHELERTIARYNKESKESDFKQQSKIILEYVRKPRIKFNTRSGFVLVDPEEVLYCLADANYTDIHLINEEEIMVSYNLSTVEEMFSNSEYVRCGRSHLINTRYLINVNRKERSCTFSVNNDHVKITVTKQGVRDLERFWG